MSDTNRPPLWQVLINAGDPPCTMQEMAAAEIRALRDWLVPEEGPRPDLSHAGTRWDQRQRLRALLTAEADRAERGDEHTSQEH